MSDFDFSDINLDFLQSTPPKNSTSVKRIPTPVHNESRTKRRIEWAKKVANVDQLLKEIQKLKCENQQLQNQLKDFQKSALDIQDLYTTEKRNHVAKAKALEELQRKYDKVDTELVVKSLKCDQLQACLSNEKERPLDYNDLVVKYLKLVHKFDSEDGVRGYHDRSIIEDLKQYCAKFKLKIHIPAGTKSKTQKLSKEDASIQCELLLDTPIVTKPERKCQSTQCQVELCNQETQHNDTTSRSTISKTQSTQCHVELRSQGTQHISTMTTRSTTTSCFIKFRSVGTNFPEIHSQPAVDDILKEFAPWQNITPISPLIDQLNEEVRKSYKTIGTCTWLCNIRRPIDFIPRNKMKRLPSSRPGSCDVSAQGTIIKQEVPTPSPSPTPNAPANQTRTNSNTAAVNSSDSTASNTSISSQNIATVNQLIDTLNATSQLSQVSNPSFQDLWHIFGIGIGMVLGLLRTTNNGNSSNAGVAANSAMHHDSVNQQQFHNWLRELYDSSVAASSATASQTRSVETAPLNNQNYMEHARDTHSVGTSPLRFNESSILTSTNIIRPEARRSYSELITEGQEMILDSTQESDHGNPHENFNTDLSTNSDDASTTSAEYFNNDSNSTLNNEISHLFVVPNTTNTVAVEEEVPPNSQIVSNSKSSKKKHQSQLIDDITEIFPEAKISKAKRKALKRLLKNNKHKKKSLKDKRSMKHIITQQTNMSLPSMEESEKEDEYDEENGTPVETAVDFLKGFFEKDQMSYCDDRSQNNTCHTTKHEIISTIEPSKLEQSVEYSRNIRQEENPNNNIQSFFELHNESYKVANTDFSSSLMCQNSQDQRHTLSYAKEFDKNYTINQECDYLDNKTPSEAALNETFSFTKPADKLKKSKYSSKKELYSSLFGDSDTDVDENPHEDKNFASNSKRKFKFNLESDNIHTNTDKYKTNLNSSLQEYADVNQESNMELEDVSSINGNVVTAVSETSLTQFETSIPHHAYEVNRYSDMVLEENSDIFENTETLPIQKKNEQISLVETGNMGSSNDSVAIKLEDKSFKETRKPVKLNIEEEIVFYPNNVILGTEFKNSTITDNSQTTTDEECSIIEISSDTQTDLEKTRHINSPYEELVIDEDPKNDSISESENNYTNDASDSKIKSEYPTPHRQSSASFDNTLNSSVVSSILDSTLYRDLLTDSICPIVDEILHNDENVLLKSPNNSKEKITRSSRKRKIECEAPAVQHPPCKRSERIKAKKIILEESIRMSISPVECGKYTNVNKNRMRIEQHSEKLAVKTAKPIEIRKQNNSMGFFREIEDRELEEPDNSVQTNTKDETKNDSLIRSEVKSDSNQKTHTKSDKSFFYSVDLIKSSTFIANTSPQKQQSISSKASSNDESSLSYSPQSPTESNVGESTFDYTESPQSPQNEEQTIDYILNTAIVDIPLELSPEYRPQRKQNSLLESLIYNYSPQKHLIITARNTPAEDTFTSKQKCTINHYNYNLKEYCKNAMELDPDIMAKKLLEKLQQNNSLDYEMLYNSILKITKEAEVSQVKESELPSIIQEMPPRHLSLTLQRLFYLLKHLIPLNSNCCGELQLKLECQVFNCQQVDKITLHGCRHLTQLYLMTCKFQETQLREHPARLFVAKCLYFYSIKAISMIHEVLMWYPTVLPPREDPNYNHSDAVITVVKHCLMCTKYDMEKPELLGKALISKLRYEYHYEPFKPTMDEVVINLVEKLKNSKFNDDLSFAFALFCKRLYPIKTETAVLQTHLLPLANEYFNEALQNTEYDSRISALLEIISIVIKPFPLDWDIEAYLNVFSRFLNAFSRKEIEEAAVRSILRLQRFGYVNCFNRLRSYKPNYELDSLTQTMLKTFIHRKKIEFLKTIQMQNPINLN